MCRHAARVKTTSTQDWTWSSHRSESHTFDGLTRGKLALSMLHPQRSLSFMPVLRVLFICLLLTGCASPSPQVLVVQTATPSLGSRHSFEMLPPSTNTDGQLPPTTDYAKVDASLRQGLLNHGYRESKKADLRVAYSLTL